MFHQNAPQLTNQLKSFPLRLNDVNLLNSSQENDPSDYFGDYNSDEALDSISLVAFLPLIVIGLLLAVLIMFFKVKSLRSNRGQLDRLEEIYQVLETVDQIAADPYSADTKLIDEIRYALILDESSFQFNRRDSHFPTDDLNSSGNVRNFNLTETDKDFIKLNNNDDDDSQLV